jgi:hypothetical protein
MPFDMIKPATGEDPSDAPLKLQSVFKVWACADGVAMTPIASTTANASLRGHIKSGQRWSLQNRPTEEAWDKVVLLRRLLRRQVCFCAPTPWTAFEYMAVMEETVEHSGNGGAVAEQFAPVVYRSIRREQSTGALIAPHYDFQ